MQQLVLNQFEKIASGDINNAQLAMAQTMQDYFLYNWLQTPVGGVLGGGSFGPSYVSAFVASLTAGIGFFYDSSQTGFSPKFRMIISTVAINVPIVANTNANNRIDLVCLAPNFAVTATAMRYVKTGGTGPVALTSVNKLKQDGYTLQVVAGTPGAVPVAPSLPAGYIAIAQILNHGSSAGMSAGAADVSDVRTLLVASPTTVGPVDVNSATTIGTTHQNKMVNVSAAAAMNLTLPTGSAFNGFQFGVADILGAFGTFSVNLVPTGGDKIMGVAANYPLLAPFGSWWFYYDSAKAVWWME